MFALRERRQHVTQEDFEMSVSKVMKKDADKNMSVRAARGSALHREERRIPPDSSGRTMGCIYSEW